MLEKGEFSRMNREIFMLEKGEFSRMNMIRIL